MSYRNERLARKFLSLDQLAESVDLGKSHLVSDGGEGARQIRGEVCAEAGAATHRGRCLAEARRKLAENGLSRLLPVLDQIVRNGKNRQESIGCLAKVWHVPKETARRRYYRGSTDLLTFFSPCKIGGEMRVGKF